MSNGIFQLREVSYHLQWALWQMQSEGLAGGPFPLVHHLVVDAAVPVLEQLEVGHSGISQTASAAAPEEAVHLLEVFSLSEVGRVVVFAWSRIRDKVELLLLSDKPLQLDM